MVMKNNKDAGKNNLGIIVEAKHEYTQQLCNVIRPVVYTSLLTMYDRAVNISENTNDILYHFQKELIKTPTWNSNVIKEETERILSSCSYFNELITAVFLSNVKILSSVKLGNNNKKFQLIIPTNENFVHHVYVKVCKRIFDNPYLFSLKKYNNNVTNNMADTFDVIDDCVVHSVRDMLPIKHILESYITHDTEISDTDSEYHHSEDNHSVEEKHFHDEETHSLEESHSMEEEPFVENDPSPKEHSTTIMDNLFEEPPEKEDTKEISLGKEPETLPETLPDTLQETLPETLPDTLPETPKKPSKSTSFFEDV
jgi:hypothetical protein